MVGNNLQHATTHPTQTQLASDDVDRGDDTKRQWYLHATAASSC